MDLDPTVLVGTYWPIPILGYVVLAIIKGWLVPRATVDRWLLIKDNQLQEAHARELVWQKTAETSEETRRDVADQLRTRQIVDEAVVKAIGSLPHIKTPEEV